MQEEGRNEAEAIEIVYKRLKDQSKNKFDEEIQYVQSEEIIEEEEKEEEIVKVKGTGKF